MMKRMHLGGVYCAAALTVACIEDSYVELERADFQQQLDGKDVDLYTIANTRGMFAKITNYGAKIEQVVVPDRRGVLGDVVLGYETLDAVIAGQPSMGAFMGRYANRISGGEFTVDGATYTGGQFTLDGVTYTVPANDGSRPNTIHGGPKGARFRVWDATQLSRSSVRMRLVFAHAEEATEVFTGFPGNLEVEVTYTVTEENALSIRYEAVSDQKTVVNFTSHPFFNLSNEPGSTVVDHVVTIDADRVVELDSNLIPTGVLRDVTNTPMDFRVPKRLGEDIGDVSYDLLARIDPNLGGYDHTYALNKPSEDALTRAASVYEPTSGRTLEVWSTEPGLQLFSANGLTGMAPRDVGKGGVAYPSRSAFCLEPMHFPDSPNQPSFPSTVLGAGETYRGQIIFAFNR